MYVSKNNQAYTHLIELTKAISELDTRSVIQKIVNMISQDIACCDVVGFFVKETENVYRLFMENETVPPEISGSDVTIHLNEDTFARQIVETKKAIYIPNTFTDSRPDINKLIRFKIYSIFGLPVYYENEIYGIVFLHNYNRFMTLEPEEQDAIEAFVNMGSIAIHNAKMFEQKEFLLNASASLAYSLSQQEINRNCLNLVRQVTRVDLFTILLFDSKTNKLTNTFTYGMESYVDYWREHAVWDLEEAPLLKQVIEECRCIKVDQAPCEFWERMGVKSGLLIPMVSKGVIVGVLCLGTVGTPKRFTDHEISMCMFISNLTSNALSNSIYAENLDSLVKERTEQLTETNHKLADTLAKLEMFHEDKTNYLTNISHELKTPISIIAGTLELMEEGTVGEFLDDERKYLRKAKESIDTLSSHIRDLLDISKLENNLYIEKQRIVFHDLFSEMVDGAKLMLVNRKLEVISNHTPETTVEVDPARYKQVFYNLLLNANKFSHPESLITIRAEASDSGVTICVEDEGIGIPEDLLKRIFERFYQVEKGFIRKYDGVGLGLSIAKQIMDGHGGRIWAESQLGKGSKFYFSV